MKVSFFVMKCLRRVINPIVSWYRHTAFSSGLQEGSGFHLLGPVYLWNDHVSVGGGTNVYPNVTFWGPGKITIGEHVELGIGTVLYSSELVQVGNNVSVAAHCYIIDSNHGIAKDKLIREQVATVKGPVIIEDDVWLGAGVTVLSGCHIGKGAVIGAGAVVNSDIPPYAIAVGVPAKVVKYRE